MLLTSKAETTSETTIKIRTLGSMPLVSNGQHLLASSWPRFSSVLVHREKTRLLLLAEAGSSRADAAGVREAEVASSMTRSMGHEQTLIIETIPTQPNKSL